MVLPGISQGPQFLNSTWNDQFITQLQMTDFFKNYGGQVQGLYQCFLRKTCLPGVLHL